MSRFLAGIVSWPLLLITSFGEENLLVMDSWSFYFQLHHLKLFFICLCQPNVLITLHYANVSTLLYSQSIKKKKKKSICNVQRLVSVSEARENIVSLQLTTSSDIWLPVVVEHWPETPVSVVWFVCGVLWSDIGDLGTNSATTLCHSILRWFPVNINYWEDHKL